MASTHDAVVVGAGPNGLAAAIELARAGRSVLVLEGEDQPGGGSRSAELTSPGFVHDVCSSAHPAGAASPFFRSLPLEDHGLRWVQPGAPMAHPLDGGRAAVAERSLDDMVASLGPDGMRWDRIFGPLVRRGDDLIEELFGPPLHVPKHLVALATFGLRAPRPSLGLARSFATDEARALVAGMAAHSVLPLSKLATGPFALFFGVLVHLVGWPVAEGGSQRITDALAAHLRSLGGEIETGRRVRAMADLPASRAVLFDLTPRQVLGIAGDELPGRYRRGLERFRYGPAVFKVDWALDGPIPWAAQGCARAGTVHVGGRMEEVAASEAAAWRGQPSARPFLILVQPTVCDPSRAPAG